MPNVNIIGIGDKINLNMNKHDENKVAKIIKDMCGIALSSLSKMYNEESRLFCHRVKKENGHLKKEGHSVRYTIITLLLNHYEVKLADIYLEVSSKCLS